MNICIFGDSITWGAYDYEKSGWVEQLKSYCIKNYEDTDIYNLGISGDNTNKLLERFENEARIREPDLIIFAIGINDSQYIYQKGNYKTDLNGFENNLSKLLAIAQGITNKIIFIGLTDVDEAKTTPISWSTEKYYDNDSIRKYDEIIKDFCKKNNLNYIDLNGIIEPDDLDDGLHPNPQGHEKIFKTVLAATKEFLIK